MDTLILVNPESGKGRGRKLLGSIRQYTEENGINCQIRITKHRGHATEIISKESSEFQKIVITGGDGTVSEAINGLDPAIETKLGLLPIGSGNDFARALGLPRFLNDNLKLVFKDAPNYLSTDIGKVRIFTEPKDLVKTNLFLKELVLDTKVLQLEKFVSTRH